MAWMSETDESAGREPPSTELRDQIIKAGTYADSDRVRLQPTWPAYHPGRATPKRIMAAARALLGDWGSRPWRMGGCVTLEVIFALSTPPGHAAWRGALERQVTYSSVPCRCRTGHFVSAVEES
jgi:hypothetical protein